jgi:hypothetical protein
MFITTDRRWDYKVDYLRQESAASSAWAWRVSARNQYAGYFNVAFFITDVLSLDRKKGPIRIEHDNCGRDPIAFVTFEGQRVLHIYRDAWEEMDQGEPECREIGGHEAGHLVLHDGSAKSFSSDPELKIKFAEPEYSSEHQADWFMDHLLLPDRTARANNDPEILVGFGLRRELVQRRLKAIEPKAQLRVLSAGDACPHCGNYLVDAGGVDLTCGVCSRRTPRFSFLS